MKKEYFEPEFEIEKFNLPYDAAITTSEGGIEDSDTGEELDW